MIHQNGSDLILQYLFHSVVCLNMTTVTAAISGIKKYAFSESRRKPRDYIERSCHHHTCCWKAVHKTDLFWLKHREN